MQLKEKLLTNIKKQTREKNVKYKIESAKRNLTEGGTWYMTFYSLHFFPCICDIALSLINISYYIFILSQFWQYFTC